MGLALRTVRGASRLYATLVQASRVKYRREHEGTAESGCPQVLSEVQAAFPEAWLPHSQVHAGFPCSPSGGNM